MSFSISLIINLKSSNICELENLIKDSGQNSNVNHIYYDYELEGINNHIKKNNKMIILEFEDEENFIIFLKFIKTIKELKIEYIYYNNSIIYCSKKYFNSISDREYDKTKLINSIENNKKNFKKINNILNFE